MSARAAPERSRARWNNLCFDVRLWIAIRLRVLASRIRRLYGRRLRLWQPREREARAAGVSERELALAPTQRAHQRLPVHQHVMSITETADLQLFWSRRIQMFGCRRPDWIRSDARQRELAFRRFQTNLGWKVKSQWVVNMKKNHQLTKQLS